MGAEFKATIDHLRRLAGSDEIVVVLSEPVAQDTLEAIRDVEYQTRVAYRSDDPTVNKPDLKLRMKLLSKAREALVREMVRAGWIDAS